MKGFVLTIAFVLALPLAAFAHSTCPGCGPYIGNIYNSGGTLTGTDAGLTLTGSNLTEIRGISGADLGTVTITTGTLYGSLQTGGWFNGGSLVITLNPGVLGGKLSGGGILYNGSFGLGGGFWSPVPGDPGTYVLQCTTYGTLANGTHGQAFVYEEFYGSINSNGLFTGTVIGGGADVVPEPGTLGLYVTGLIGMGGAIRRKLSA